MILQAELQQLCVSLIGRTEGNMYLAAGKNKTLGSGSRIQIYEFNPYYLDYICDVFNVSKKQLKSKSRKRELVNIRAICYEYLFNATDWTLATIGNEFGKDHATVLHGRAKYKEWINSNDRIMLDLVEQFNSKIEKI